MFSWINQHRIFILFAVMFFIAALSAPNFFNPFNLNSLLKTTNLYAMLAIGMTLVMICGQLDLSVQAVMNLGAVLTLGMFSKSRLPWGAAIAVGLLTGAAFGLVNGILVAKAKINSFIVTLGTMTIAQGCVFLYCKAGSIGVGSDYSFSDWMTGEIAPLLPPITIITLVTVCIFAFLLSKTRFGRNIYMVGGNSETAWLAGINRDLTYVAAFGFSGALAALSGILFSIAQGTAVPNMGDKGISPLMLTIAATIIGGVSMSGGRGGVIKSYFAVLTLVTLFNMLSCFGTGYEAQILAAGFVLAVIVLYESVSIYFSDKIKGIRPKLLVEAAQLRKTQA